MNQGELAGRIMALRRANGLTQKQLADKLNITDKAVSKWERGLSYPDITVLLPLSEILGVTVNDLLGGTAEEMAAPEKKDDEPKPDKPHVTSAARLSVGRAMPFVMRVVRTGFWVICLLAVLTCGVVDLAISGTFTWSVIVFASIGFVVVTFAPVFLGGVRRFPMSLLTGSVAVFPFLYIIERCTLPGGWFGAIAFPCAALGAVYSWAAYFLLCRTRMNRWNASAILVIVLAAFSAAVNGISASFMAERFPWESVVLSSVACICIAVFLVLRGHRLKKK